MTTTITRPRTRGHWLIPVGLILLTLIPIISGSFRLVQLSGGPELTAEAARFTDSPLPVILHIVSATVFSIVGAFQFLPALRQGRRSWHQRARRVLIPAGLIVALSGMWMATFSALPIGDGPALRVIRLIFGSYMVISVLLAIRALIRHNFPAHGAWMTRAYALGVAAGTQALMLIPGSIMFGPTNEHSRAVTMGTAWLVNLGAAELVIRRSHADHQSAAQTPNDAPPERTGRHR